MHFKIINKISAVAEFLKKKIKFEVDQCPFCNRDNEKLDNLFCLFVFYFSFLFCVSPSFVNDILYESL